jgi:predicted alpha/beta-hydrolase family hydrolase
MIVNMFEVQTVYGTAHVHLDAVPDPAFLLLLTHGSNGGVDAADLLAVREAALGLGGVVARVVQPFRVAGRRAPGPAVRQDEAWVEVVSAVRSRTGQIPLIQGGRSNGARVACRTAAAVRADGVVALAFPLHPPSRPERSRADELRAAGTQVLVVNGDRDPFGIPDRADATEVVVLPGERHDLNRNPAAVGRAVEPWLRRWASQRGRSLAERDGLGGGGVTVGG